MVSTTNNNKYTIINFDKQYTQQNKTTIQSNKQIVVRVQNLKWYGMKNNYPVHHLLNSLR